MIEAWRGLSFGNRYGTEQILHTITLLAVSEQVSDPGKIGFINTHIISNMHVKTLIAISDGIKFDIESEIQCGRWFT